MTGTNSNSLARAFSSISGRNRIINGDCSIAQRASATFTSTAGYGGPDRYSCGNGASAGGSFTQSQGTIVYNGITKYAIVQTVNTAITSNTGGNYWTGIQQKIEGYNAYDLLGEFVSISFIFNTNVTGTYCVALRDSTAANSWVSTFNATANTPQYYSFLVPALPTTLSVPQSSGIGMILNIGAINIGNFQTPAPGSWISGSYFTSIQSASSNWGATAGNFISATEIQLEQGQNASNFERRPKMQEFALCQRYYQIFTGLLLAYYSGSSDGGGYQSVFGVPMTTAAPSLSVVNTNTGGGYSGTLVPANYGNNAWVVYFATATSLGDWCAFSLTVNAEL